MLQHTKTSYTVLCFQICGNSLGMTHIWVWFLGVYILLDITHVLIEGFSKVKKEMNSIHLCNCTSSENLFTFTWGSAFCILECCICVRPIYRNVFDLHINTPHATYILLRHQNTTWNCLHFIYSSKATITTTITTNNNTSSSTSSISSNSNSIININYSSNNQLKL